MQPEFNDELMTAGQLAKNLNRSSYGVKKALKRLGIHPEAVLNMVSYYPATAEAALADAMREPNRQTTAA